MPRILWIDGFRVVIYPNDHEPAHVHVIGADNEALFNLNCPDGPVMLRENFGVSRQDAKRVAAELAGQLERLCGEWSRIHG